MKKRREVCMEVVEEEQCDGQRARREQGQEGLPSGEGRGLRRKIGVKQTIFRSSKEERRTVPYHGGGRRK
jgi:hypothetical protein